LINTHFCSSPEGLAIIPTLSGNNSSGNFKHDIFTRFACVGVAPGNGNQLELLDFLAQGERNVDDLTKVSALNVTNTSQYLQ